MRARTEGDWVERATPSVPRPFIGWLRHGVDTPVRPDPEQLIRWSLEAFERRHDSRSEHGGAFDLLAADGWITYAAQAVLDGEDPGSALVEMAERISVRTEGR